MFRTRIAQRLSLIPPLLSLLLLTGLYAGQQAQASITSSRAAAPGLGVITGTLPGAASPASPAAVYVSGMRPRGRDARPGQVFTDPLIGQARITSGRSFRITISDTAAARALVIPGSVINTAIAVVSARGESFWHVPVRVQLGTGPIPATPAGRLPAYSLALLRRAAAWQESFEAERQKTSAASCRVRIAAGRSPAAAATMIG